MGCPQNEPGPEVVAGCHHPHGALTGNDAGNPGTGPLSAGDSGGTGGPVRCWNRLRQLEGEVMDAPRSIAQPRPQCRCRVGIRHGAHQPQSEWTGPGDVDGFPGVH